MKCWAHWQVERSWTLSILTLLRHLTVFPINPSSPYSRETAFLARFCNGLIIIWLIGLNVSFSMESFLTGCRLHRVYLRALYLVLCSFWHILTTCQTISLKALCRHYSQMLPSYTVLLTLQVPVSNYYPTLMAYIFGALTGIWPSTLLNAKPYVFQWKPLDAMISTLTSSMANT